MPSPTPHKDELHFPSSLLPGFNEDGLALSHTEIGHVPFFRAEPLFPAEYYIYRDCLIDVQTRWRGVTEAVQATNFFDGQVVVDLGAGREPWGFYLAVQGGACGYLGVEPVPDHVNTLAMRTRKSQRCRSIAIEEDIEPFLRRIPNKSVSFIVSGLSSELNSTRPPSFWNAVRSNLDRSLASNGSIL